MRILLVDDDDTLVQALKVELAGEGFVVDTVRDGISSVWAAIEFDYDVIVLEIALPGLNGYDVLKEIRRRGIRTPVMMLTGKNGEYDELEAFELGVDDYVTKPFSLCVLVARLHALVRRSTPRRPPPITVGSLVLDRGRRRVERDGVPVPLTAREYGLLEYLMRSSGRVVSKAEILDNVWDSAYEGGDNVVEVYIAYLRRKLDHPGRPSMLHTVRGHGYRLDPDTAEDGPLEPSQASPSIVLPLWIG